MGADEGLPFSVGLTNGKGVEGLSTVYGSLKTHFFRNTQRNTTESQISTIFTHKNCHRHLLEPLRLLSRSDYPI